MLRDQAGAPIVLGSGGFGATLHGYRSSKIGDLEIQENCAIKILHPAAAQNPERRRQMIAEILALRDLKHPNLVQYINTGEEDGVIYLVTELCRGGDLERLVADVGPFRERTALQVILQVCEGMKEVHRKNFLHRDLKPRNILLLEPMPPIHAHAQWFGDAVEDGRLCFKVVGFDLICRLGEAAATSGFAGSPMFCSPEQVRERGQDVRTDIYSLGMTLWYLVAGHGPLLRQNGRPVEDSREAMRLHASPQPHDPSFPPHLSAEFAGVLSRMVRKSPDERFASSAEVAAAIKQVLAANRVTEPEVPVAAAASPAAPEPQVSLVFQPEWAVGSCEDFYSDLVDCGRRWIGRFFRATSNQTQRTVGLTEWVAGDSADALREHQLAAHFQRLQTITSSADAPASLTAVVEVRRTKGEWCVAEEWSEGVPLAEVLACRGRTLSLEEIARLLTPVAEAADFLLKNQFTDALLTPSDIRLCGLGSSPADRSWLSRPVAQWGTWHAQVSAVAVPPELAPAPPSTPAGGAILASLSIDTEATFGIGNAFCRLFYRMVEGSDVAAAADWDENSYLEVISLSAASNALLRRIIGGESAVRSVSDLLRRICANEGVYRV